MSDECFVEMKPWVFNLTLSPLIYLQRSGGKPDSHHQPLHPEDLQQAGGSVSIPVLQTKRVMHAFFYLILKVWLFFSQRPYWGSCQLIECERQEVDICSDSEQIRLIVSNPAGILDRTLKCFGLDVWQQLCSVQIIDGQPYQKSSWKHLPLSLAAGRAVSCTLFISDGLVLFILKSLNFLSLFLLFCVWLSSGRNLSRNRIKELPKYIFKPVGKSLLKLWVEKRVNV